MCKVSAVDMIVGLDEDLPQSALSDGIVLGIEFVKSMERVTILQFNHLSI